jgi:ankyrin repeat protein
MEEIVKLIRNRSASDEEIIRKIDAHPTKNELAKCVDKRGDTLLMHALFHICSWSRVCTPGLIEYILQLGSNPNHTNRHGGNVLQRAYWAVEAGASPEVLILVLSYGANPNNNLAFTIGGERLLVRALHKNRIISSLLLLYGGKLRDHEYATLSDDANLMLTDFYDRVKLSHISLAHVKRMKYTSQKC